MRTTDGPFLRSDLPVAGFAIIEAADVDEAVRIASASPCAVAQGVIDVWPLGPTASARTAPATMG